jgi:hypothetical protein
MAITKNAGRQNPLIAEIAILGGVNVTTTALSPYEAIDLPAGATIIGGFYEVTTVFTGTGTVAVHVGSTVVGIANDGDATGVFPFLEAGLDVPTTTAADTVDAVVATATLTDGVGKIVVEYVIADRATEAQ